MKQNDFTRYRLCPEIIESLSLLSYHTPTPIQEQVLLPALAKKDIIAKSKTGSGKTAAFAIPLCQEIIWEENRPQAIVLEPTRELAYQVHDEIFNIGRKKRIKVPVVFGGFPFDKQAVTLKQKSHIVVGTPGRMLDHLKEGTLKPEAIRIIVIDEADLMLDMGFLDDVKKILEFVPAKPQILLFSATMNEPLYALAGHFMDHPEEITIESGTQTADTIEQNGYFVTEDSKYEDFLRILYKENPSNAIIFCATREMTEVLYYKLKKDKVYGGMLHGLIDQKVRIRTIEEFKARAFRILIATDVAARGVDVEEISHVFNYDMPMSKETYVHRIGRTGRNGKTGKAVSLIKEEEKKMLGIIERYTGAEIQIKELPPESETEQLKETFLKFQQKKQVRRKKKGDVFSDEILKLTISGGRKSKLRTCEVVGTISAIEGINGKEDIGVIDIRDSITYVEILNNKGKLVLEKLPHMTMKGKCRKVSITR